MIKNFLVLLWSVAYPFCGNAKDQLKKIGPDQGLSNQNITSIFQDHNGFIWLGTTDGLNRFDGYQSKTYFYNKLDNNSLLNNEIYSIYEDSENDLFVGTGFGLQIFQPLFNDFISIRFSEKAYPVKTIIEDRKGNVWVGTYGGGLLKYQKKEKILQASPFRKLDFLSISALFEDRNGNVWIGTESSGLYYIERNSENLITFSARDKSTHEIQDFKNIKIKAITQDNIGNIWIASYGKGIYKYNISQAEFIIHSDIVSLNALVSSAITDKNGQVYFGTDGDGIVFYNPSTSKKTIFQHDANNNFSLSTNSITSLHIDNQENLWIGTYLSGINILQLRNESFFKKINTDKYPIPNNNITGITKDQEDNLWLSSDGGGIFMMDYKTKAIKKPSLKPFYNMQYNNGLYLTTDKQGRIWAGFYQGGFLVIDQLKQVKQFKDEDVKISQTAIDNDIRVIIQDKKGNYWIGTNGQGIFYFHPDSGIIRRLVKDYSGKKEGLTGNFIRSICEDSKGYLWIGSTYGLTRYNPKKETYVNFYEERLNNQSLLSNNILSIKESTDGIMYFGTSEGLSVLKTPVWAPNYDSLAQKSNFNDPKKNNIFGRFMNFFKSAASNSKKAENYFSFRNYTMNEGLPDRSIYCINEDNSKQIWLGTGKGLSVFSPEKQEFINYFSAENGTEIYNTSASYKDEKGQLFFGSTTGLTCFFPDSIKNSSEPQKVTITDIHVNFESIFDLHNDHFKDNGIILKANERSVSIEFSAMEMYHPEDIKYEYQLSGFDENWHRTDARRRYVTYTNLKAGEYTFKVRANNKNGIWTKEATEIKIVMKPPFWKTWWFSVLLILITSLAFYTLYRLRVKGIEQQNRKLEQLVEERSKELIEERDKQKSIEQERNEMLIKQKELESSNLLAEKELIRLKNESLQHEVERQTLEMQKKNNEFFTLAVQITQKIEFLAKLKKNLSDILDKANPEMHSTITGLIKQIEKDNDIKKEWDQFEKYFNHTNNNFILALKDKYPDLTPHDIRMCAYLRMNLSNKEIAALQNISIRGVEKSRFRLRKKLLLDTDENIVSFLMSFNS